MPNNITLLAENFLLKKKLEIAQNHMKREVLQQKNIIAKEKTAKEIEEKKSNFFNENVSEIVTKKIQEFFGEIMLVNIPAKIIKNIVSAEITYYNFRQHTDRDWFAVISSYHKALDIIIEEYIAKPFRLYINKKRLPRELENDPINKALHKVIHSNYSLSIGRLFHILQQYKQNDKALKSKEKTYLPLYVHLFFKFIHSNSALKKLFLEEDFSTMFQEIIASEVLGSKRHSWSISFVETRESRRLLIWDFKNKNCLMYKLIELGEIE